MKRLLIAAVALSLVGGTAASAQPHGNANGHHRADKAAKKAVKAERKAYKKWAKGQRLPAQYRTPTYYVDYRTYDLREPPRGYRWVRVDDQYLMIAVATGLIASIITGS